MGSASDHQATSSLVRPHCTCRSSFLSIYLRRVFDTTLSFPFDFFGVTFTTNPIYTLSSMQDRPETHGPRVSHCHAKINWGPSIKSKHLRDCGSSPVVLQESRPTQFLSCNPMAMKLQSFRMLPSRWCTYAPANVLSPKAETESLDHQRSILRIRVLRFSTPGERDNSFGRFKLNNPTARP